MTQPADPNAERVHRTFDCLGHARRRNLLEIVEYASTPIPVDTVVEEIAAAESDRGPGSTAADSPEEIAITLVHTHLPKLEAARIIDVDGVASTIAEGDRFGRAMDHVRLV